MWWPAQRLRAVRSWLARRLGGHERGSAIVEFLGVSLLLLIPVIYLILTLGRVQAATFAAEGAAREAGRLIAQADTMSEGLAGAHLAVELAFADQGFDVDGAQVLQVTCQANPCLSPGGYIHLEVGAGVDLPGAPGFLTGVMPQAAHVNADALTAVPEFRESP